MSLDAGLEDASNLEQASDHAAEPVIAQSEAFVVQQPCVLTQPRVPRVRTRRDAYVRHPPAFVRAVAFRVGKRQSIQRRSSSLGVKIIHFLMVFDGVTHISCRGRAGD